MFTHSHAEHPVTEPTHSLSQRLATITFGEDSVPTEAHSSGPMAILEHVVDGAKTLLDKAVPHSLSTEHLVLDAFDSLPKWVQADIIDSERHPEISKVATLRRDNEFPPEEREFQNKRKAFMKTTFAKYIGVAVDEVELEDIPIIAIAGSGGGYKAMITTSAYMKAMAEDELFDCVMYMTGVSGSCWTLSNFYTSAKCSPAALTEHYKKILPNHPANPFHILKILGTNTQSRVPALFGGLELKKLVGLQRGIVDTYGALMTGHFMSDDESLWDPEDFKLSRHSRWIDQGQSPMPIYTCVRHERPWKDRKDLSDPKSPTMVQANEENQKEYTQGVESPDLEEKASSIAKGTSWWQWFEATPYYIGSDELRVWVPTWAFGRKFEGGKSVDMTPEQSFSLQVGLFGSAMCAPWSDTIETAERAKSKSAFGAAVRRHLGKLIEPGSPAIVRELLASHPVHAPYNWNPLYKTFPEPSPPGLNNSPRIQLIDAGSDNNQPLYPLTRPGRKVDVAFVFDASEDIEDHIVTVDINKFGARKGLTFTLQTPEPPAQIPQQFGKDDKNLPLPPLPERYAHRYCQVYLGSPTGENEGIGIHGEPLADQELTLIYMPTLPNVGMSNYEPNKNTFAKLEYTSQEVEDLVNCMELNWRQETAVIRETIKGVWAKKKAARLAALKK